MRGWDSYGTFLPVLNEVEKASIRERQPLPEAYLGLSDEEMALRIAAARAALGDRLVILGHHYQRDEVIKFADYTGDSFKLANAIAQAPARRLHRVLRRALHGGERRHPGDAAPAHHPAGPRRRLLDGRHGAGRSARDLLVGARADGPRVARRAGHLHQLRRGD